MSNNPIKILLIEPVQNFATRLKEFLESDLTNAYEFLETTTKVEGVDAYFTWKPDCILAEMELPDGTGLQALQEIRDRAETIAVPMILLGTSEQAGQRSEVVAAGAQELLVREKASGDNLCWLVAFAIEKAATYVALDQRQRELKTINRKLKQNLKRLEEEIAQREGAEDSVRRSESRFRGIFECGMIPMGIWRKDGSVISANDSLLDLLGFTREDLDRGAINLEALTPPEYVELDNAALEERRANGFYSPYEKELLDVNGDRIPVLVGGASFYDTEHSGVFCAVDLRERKRSEAEREELLQRERDARTIAEAASHAKDEFLAVVSHELRAPLNAMLGWARILQTKTVPQETLTHAIDTIERSARMQSNIIDDLLDMARITSGKLRVEVRPIDLTSVVDAAVDVVRPAAEAKSIEIIRVYDSEIDVITGDGDRLQQVVWNLLSNAVKFTVSGGQVIVRLERIDPFVCIQVSDSGKGIPAETLPLIFDRFTQADRSSTRRQGGLGLGLALARHLVEAHGGTIKAESAGDGKGSTFTISLPLRAVREVIGKDEDESRPQAIRPNPNLLAGLNILVVDDEADARDLVETLLAGYGATVVSSASAAEAFSTLLEPASGERFDVLVSDIGLPDEDGNSLIRRIRALEQEELRKIPAVALTAYGRSVDRVRALSAGFQMHVPKPVEAVELATVIAALTRRSGLAATE